MLSSEQVYAQVIFSVLLLLQTRDGQHCTFELWSIKNNENIFIQVKECNQYSFLLDVPFICTSVHNKLKINQFEMGISGTGVVKEIMLC